MAMARWLLSATIFNSITNIQIRNYGCSVVNQPQGSCKIFSCNNKPNSLLWLCIFTTWLPQCISLLYLGLPTSTSPVVTQCMHTCHFCRKPQITPPGYKQCYLGQIFLIPSKIYSCKLHHYNIKWFC